jgi:hypothetical protein
VARGGDAPAEARRTSGSVKGRMRPKLMTVTTRRRKTKAIINRENQRGPVHQATKLRIG